MGRKNEVLNTYVPAKTEGVQKLVITSGFGDQHFYFYLKHRALVEREKWYVLFKYDNDYKKRVAYPVCYLSDANNILEIFPEFTTPGGACNFPRFLAQCNFPRRELRSTRMRRFCSLGARIESDYRDDFITCTFRGSENEFDDIPHILLAEERMRKRAAGVEESTPTPMPIE